MKRNLTLSANTLAKVALSAWLLSLCIPGLVLYPDSRSVFGVTILISGWLSPASIFLSDVSPNFAWFANVFFLYSIKKILNGQSPSTSPILSVLLSFDAFRLERVVMNEGGGSVPIYGYGWGFVLWLLSIGLLLLASGKRRGEYELEGKLFSESNGLTLAGGILTMAVAGSAGCFSAYDRLIANYSEQERLSWHAFKKNEICSEQFPDTLNPIRNFSGTLELVLPERLGAAKYPFGDVRALLSWGIPVVRVGGVDYAEESGDEVAVIYSVAGIGEPGAVLYVENDRYDSIGVRLVEAGSSRVVFEQKWKREVSHYYCPDYFFSSRAGQPPRSLVLGGLGLADDDLVFQSFDKHESAPPRLKGVVIEKRKSETSLPYMRRTARGRTGSADELADGAPDSACPPEVGFRFDRDLVALGVAQGFVVGEKRYVIPADAGGRSICDDGFVHFYSFDPDVDGIILNIQRRDLNGFNLKWRYIIGLPLKRYGDVQTNYSVASVAEENGLLILDLRKSGADDLITVEVKIPVR